MKTKKPHKLKRLLPRRLNPSLLRRRRRDPRPPLPRNSMLLASTVLLEKSLLHQEVAEVAVVAVVATEEATESTEAIEATEATEALAVPLEAVAVVRDVVQDPKVKRVREDPDQRVDSAVAEDRDLKVKRVREDQDPRVDSAVAEVRDPKVLRVNIAQEPRVAEAEDPLELKVRKVPPLKVRMLSPEERELFVRASTALKAKRESNGTHSTERTALEEAEEALLRVVLAEATGEPLRMRSKRPPLKAPSVRRLPLRRRRRRPSRRRSRPSSRKSENLLRMTSTPTSSLLLSTLLRRRRLPRRRKSELTRT